MESTIMDVALSQGIWAVMAIFLLMYVVKGNEKRDLKQEEQEKNYQEIIGGRVFAVAGLYDRNR